MLHRRALVPSAPATAAVLLPGANAGEWELCRRLPAAAPTDTTPGATTRQTFASLEAAAANVDPEESYVLVLPLDMGLVQRMALPAAEPAELEEMARIQLEKILPYPAESVGVAFQEISRTETDVVLSVASIHQDRLVELSAPLVGRGCWPLKVVFGAFVLAGSGSAEENTAYLYREAGKSILGVSEGGRLGFAQILSGQTAEDLASELPATLLGAELEGVPMNFSRVSLDERMADWRDTLAVALDVPVAPFDPAGTALLAAPLAGGDLSPVQWQAERQRGERRARLRRQVLLAAGGYVGLLLLAFLYLGVRQIQVMHLDSRLAAVRPLAEYSRAANTRWRALSPAVEPSQYFVETLKNVYDCVPPGDTIRLTAVDLGLRGLDVTGEAPSSTAAVEFTEKLKALPQLRSLRLEADPPRLQGGGGRWGFHVYQAKETF